MTSTVSEINNMDLVHKASDREDLKTTIINVRKQT